MQKYTITYIKKLDVNKFSDEKAVATVEAEMLGPAKRNASEAVNNWLLDNNVKIRNKGEWTKDVKRGGFVREYLVTMDDTACKLIFILREA